MSSSPFVSGSAPRPSTATSRAPAVADAVVPGDPYAGVALYEAAAGWNPEPAHTSFVRATAMAHGLVHVAVLRFDAWGFGAFRAELLPADGRLTVGLRELLRDADHWVVVSDGSRAAQRVLALGEGAQVETRGLDEVAVFEAGMLGLERDNEVAFAQEGYARSAYYDRDVLAAHALASAAQADLYALVAMAGAGVSVH